MTVNMLPGVYMDWQHLCKTGVAPLCFHAGVIDPWWPFYKILPQCQKLYCGGVWCIFSICGGSGWGCHNKGTMENPENV